MSPGGVLEPLFLDTFFALALLNAEDNYHAEAKAFLPRLRDMSAIWITDAILVEVGNGLARRNRSVAASFIEGCLNAPNFHIRYVDVKLLSEGLEIYKTHQDKQWGLTDCISFAVMKERGINAALTGDKHFRQAGFRTIFDQPAG